MIAKDGKQHAIDSCLSRYDYKCWRNTIGKGGYTYIENPSSIIDPEGRPKPKETKMKRKEIKTEWMNTQRDKNERKKNVARSK